MKKSIISILILSCSFFLFTNYTTTNNIDPNLCLEIDGKIAFDSKTVGNNNCIIHFICKDSIIDSLILTKKENKFKLLLKKNSFYTIKISQNGCLSKKIFVDTKIPESESEITGIYKFKFQTKMLDAKKYSNIKNDISELPIAVISYDYDKEYFYYNKNYTKKINNLYKQKSLY